MPNNQQNTNTNQTPNQQKQQSGFDSNNARMNDSQQGRADQSQSASKTSQSGTQQNPNQKRAS